MTMCSINKQSETKRDKKAFEHLLFKLLDAFHLHIHVDGTIIRWYCYYFCSRLSVGFVTLNRLKKRLECKLVCINIRQKRVINELRRGEKSSFKASFESLVTLE